MLKNPRLTGIYLPSGIIVQMAVGQMSIGRAQTMDQNTRYEWAGPPRICGRQNVRSISRGNAGQNTKDTHPVPGSSNIAFCPRAGPSLQTKHSPLYPILSLPFSICIQSIYLLIRVSSSAANLLPVYHSF